LNNIIYVPTHKYVYFNEDGTISAVSNSNKQDGNYIQVDNIDVMNLVTGKETFDQYKVILDKKSKQYVLKHIYSQEDHYYSINDQVYEIPSVNIEDPDLIITQDISNKCWTFTLNDTLRQTIIQYNTPMGFSITHAGDPHQLVKYIIVKLSDLVSNKSFNIPFEYESEIDETALSVYTTKRLETYYYEVKQ
jgi:hypothetical protein